jgi:hypothetical protein
MHRGSPPDFFRFLFQISEDRWQKMVGKRRETEFRNHLATQLLPGSSLRHGVAGPGQLPTKPLSAGAQLPGKHRIGVGRADWSRLPLPPNRTGGFLPARRDSPVDGLNLRED